MNDYQTEALRELEQQEWNQDYERRMSDRYDHPKNDEPTFRHEPEEVERVEDEKYWDYRRDNEV